MTKFETMDNMNTNFVSLSDQELMEMEGGFDPFTVTVGGIALWKLVAAGGAGLAAGYFINK